MKAAARISMSFGFGFVSILLVVAMALGIGHITQIKGNLDNINMHNAQSKLAMTMYLSVTERALAMRNLILLADPDEIQIEVSRIRDQEKKYASAEKELSDIFASLPDIKEEEKAKLEQIKEVAVAATSFTKKATELALAKKSEEAYALLRFTFRPMQKQWWELLHELIALEEIRNERATIAADQAYDHARTLMLVFGGMALISSIIAACLISRNITNLKQAERSLKQSHAQLHELAVHRETVQEEERKNIARELHDELGQILTALHMHVSVLRLKFGANNPPLVEHAHALTDMVETTMQVVRRVVSNLRPPALDMGIATALEWLVEEFARHSRIACKLTIEEKEMALDESRAVAIFRIVQESLTNVARHAHARQVNVTLKRQDADCILKISDNGKGFDPDMRRPGSFGLDGVRERVHTLGGEVALFSASGQGTVLEVRLPIGNASAYP